MLGKLKSKFVNWLLKGVHLQELHIGEHSVVISTTGANLDGQKIENLGAPDSDDDVPRRDTIDSKILTHKNIAAAHHAKTTSASELTSGVLPSINRLPALTTNKIWKGVANRPVEVDVPAPGATLTVAETEVFSGTTPTGWTDLNLSGTVGSNPALVLLKVDLNSADEKFIAFRKNGDTDEFYAAAESPRGCACGKAMIDKIPAFLVATDDSGKVEWKCESSVGGSEVYIIAYIK